MALKMKSKPAAPAASGPKLAKAGKASKPAAKGAKPAAGPTYKEGAEVIFKGYGTAPDTPVFAEGDRLTIVAKGKDDNGAVIYDAVKTEDYEAYQADNDSVEGDQVHGAEIDKAPKEEVDPYAITVVSVGRLDEVLSAHGDDPLEAAKAMQDEAAENLFLFGGLAAQLYANRTFQTYGEYEDEEVDGKKKHGTGWDRFCRDNFNMGGRDVNRHVRIYTNMSSLTGLDWSEISKNKKIGYVKLEKIAGVATQDNVTELLARAEELNVEDFRAVIRDEYVTDGEARTGASGPKVKRTTFKFQLFEDQGEGVKYVIEQAKKTTGIEDENQLMELIFMQWAQANLSETAFTKARAEKRKAQTALKKAGVDISSLKEADATLEEHLADDSEGEGAEAEAEA